MKLILKPLADQVIVITGASSGIGLATAKFAAQAGAKLVLCARNEDALADIVSGIVEQAGDAIYVKADVSNVDDLTAMADAAIDKYGRIDTWVNNAGVGLFGRLAEVEEADSRKLFDINFWGLVNGTIIAANHLKESGGAIINVGSVVSDVGFPIQGMYGASKHAVMGFTDAFRMEMLNEKAPISVTLIKPTSIDTPFTVHAKNYTSGKPTLPPPIYTPEDVAGAILHAAVHGGREYYVGGGGKVLSSLNKFLPSLVDWFGSTFVPGQSIADIPAGRDAAGNLSHPVQDGDIRGDTERPVMRSAYTKASEHPVITGAVAASFGIGLTAFIAARRRPSKPALKG